MNIIIVSIVLLPLLGFLINFFFGARFFPKNYIAIAGNAAVLLSCVLSFFVFFSLSAAELQKGILVDLYPFIEGSHFSLHVGFLADALSITFMLIITGIGFLIHLFSISYMEEESSPYYARYFSYLNLFIFFMLLLVMGSNMIVTFAGWEGVGLCSYLLIGFWNKKQEYIQAANKAFIMNRIGDLGFLIATFLIVFYFGSLDYAALPEAISQYKGDAMIFTIISLLLFFAATGKSAQIPLFTWLPDAMAGPTPVSALIHAATMVTGGIFLIARMSGFISLSIYAQQIILFVGMATAFVAATIAIVQRDIKKVLAYSTVSQLGFMVVALGMGEYVSAIFHVMTHAFFKALLFLGSGSIIYALHHEQDMRRMGGLRKLMPITHLTFLVACLSIAGIPPFAGFFSKDEILVELYDRNIVCYAILQITSLLTSFYIFRLYALVFLGKYRGTMENKNIVESSLLMKIPLVILAIGVCAAGLLGLPAFIAEPFGGDHALRGFLSPWLREVSHSISVEREALLSAFAAFASLLVIGAAIYMYGKKNRQVEEKMNPAESFLFHQWRIDELYRRIIILPFDGLSYFLFSRIDVGIFRRMLNRMEEGFLYMAKSARGAQNGALSIYLRWVTLAFFVVMFSILFFL